MAWGRDLVFRDLEPWGIRRGQARPRRTGSDGQEVHQAAQQPASQGHFDFKSRAALGSWSVSFFMCKYDCVCTHMHVHTCINTCVYTCVHVDIHTYIYIKIDLYTIILRVYVAKEVLCFLFHGDPVGTSIPNDHVARPQRSKMLKVRTSPYTTHYRDTFDYGSSWAMV